MEILYSELKRKEVINVSNGVHLGKVCDLTFSQPENKVLGFTVTGGKGLCLTKRDLFIPMCDIVKIGEDVVLTKLADKKEEKECPPPKNGRPPKGAPPQCDQPEKCDPFPPCPPSNCPPSNNCPPDPCGPCSKRRNYDEYE